MARSKKTKQVHGELNSKKSNIEKTPHGYWGLSPEFSFRRYDSDATWSVPADGKPTTDTIFSLLRDISSMKWIDIMQASGGRSHGTNSHFISIDKLIKHARQRASEIELGENELFSLRLQGTARLWGLIEPENGCFYVVWYDPEHQLYPLER